MADIVERLRGNNQRPYFGDGAIMYDAANEIERLRAALANIEDRVNYAIGQYHNATCWCGEEGPDDPDETLHDWVFAQVRAALSPSPPIPKPSRSNRDKTQRHRSAFAEIDPPKA